MSEHIVQSIRQLIRLGASISEVDYRSIHIIGETSNPDILSVIQELLNECNRLTISPIVKLENNSTDIEDFIDDLTTRPSNWTLIIGKEKLVFPRLRENEINLFFFSSSELGRWASSIDPLDADNELISNDRLTLRVADLENEFGGNKLWIVPAYKPSIPQPHDHPLPTSDKIHALIHTTGKSPIRLDPDFYSITWGDITQNIALIFRRFFAISLAASLCHEIKMAEDHYVITLKGARRNTLNLFDEKAEISNETIIKLCEVVIWIYEERPETRHRLIMDRLCLDINPPTTFLQGICESLSIALEQAKDSYHFVILERKDAYHKELRELMKDLKSQSDLYAAKVRDLVNSLGRDVLGIFILIGVSLISKIDKQNITIILNSQEVSLFMKFLAGYFFISFLANIASTWKDVDLSSKDLQAWLPSLRNYTTLKDIEEKVQQPLQRRKDFLCAAMLAYSLIYIVIIIFTWNAPKAIPYLLNGAKPTAASFDKFPEENSKRKINSTLTKPKTEPLKQEAVTTNYTKEKTPLSDKDPVPKKDKSGSSKPIKGDLKSTSS